MLLEAELKTDDWLDALGAICELALTEDAELEDFLLPKILLLTFSNMSLKLLELRDFA